MNEDLDVKMQLARAINDCEVGVSCCKERIRQANNYARRMTKSHNDKIRRGKIGLYDMEKCLADRRKEILKQTEIISLMIAKKVGYTMILKRIIKTCR